MRKAWNELETARQQYVLLDSSITQAQENLRLQELAFREGQATSLDVIDARLGLGGAQVERAQAAYQYDVALAQLLALLQSVTKTPKKRLATKPSYSSQQKRLQSKKQQGQTKALRQQKRFD